MRGFEGNDNKRIIKLVMSLLVILLVLSAAVGVTFALFTSRDDGKIGINVTSGKCRVDIVDTDNNTLVGDVLQFVARDGRESIYFEPGATYVTEGFKIKNIGNIPINFRAYISNDEAFDMLEFESAFELWITTDPVNLETATPLVEFKGELDPEKDSQTHYLVVRMKQDAGNTFQGKEYDGIGITVYAVQGNVSVEE